MRVFCNYLITYLAWWSILICTQACQLSTRDSFSIAQDSCFVSNLATNPSIKYQRKTLLSNFWYPIVQGATLDMDDQATNEDSLVFLSSSRELRISQWNTFKFAGSNKVFKKDGFALEDLKKFNNYAVAQHLFTQDTIKIESNLLYEACAKPHFVIKGTSRWYYYLMKTELSKVPIFDRLQLKSCLMRFPKILKSKYWGTTHQMLANTGANLKDTAALNHIVRQRLLKAVFKKFMAEEGNKTKFHFTIPVDSCFKNKIKPYWQIKRYPFVQKQYGYTAPIIEGSQPTTNPDDQHINYVMFLSPDKKILITIWHDYAVPGDIDLYSGMFDENQPWTNQLWGLKVFNSLALSQQAFSRDSTAKVIKNVLYEKCAQPHFIMQAENEEYIFLLKSELSRSPKSGKNLVKNYQIRMAKDATDKYWNTAHQMLEEFGYYLDDQSH